MADELAAIANFLKDYGTLLAVPLAALVGSIAYRMQKSADRRSALIELRRITYTQYLGSLFRQIEKNTPENNLDHNQRLMELSAVASDEVVRCAGQHKQYFMDPETRVGEIDSNVARDLIAKTILAMRKDCFEKSSLRIEDVNKITPFR